MEYMRNICFMRADYSHLTKHNIPLLFLITFPFCKIRIHQNNFESPLNLLKLDYLYTSTLLHLILNKYKHLL